MKELQPGEKLYADLPGLRATDSPPLPFRKKILNAPAHPDIVIRSKETAIIELTSQYNSPNCLHNANARKEAIY